MAPSNATSRTAPQSAVEPAATGAVDHAIIALKLLAASEEPLGVNELARRLGLHKSTVSRLLRTLERHHFVQRDPAHGRLSLGLGVVALAGPMLGSMDAITVGRPTVAEVAERSGETTSLALWNGREAVMVEQVLGTRTVVHYTWRGKAVSAHSTAVGKVFLAYLPGALDEVLQEPLERFTPHTITEPGALRAEIARVAAAGNASNIEENELESCGVAAPCFDFQGRLAAVLSIAVPRHRFEPPQHRRLLEIVMAGADALSARLGAARRC